MDTATREPTTVGSMLKEEFLIPMGITQQQLAQMMGSGSSYRQLAYQWQTSVNH